jgi:hypothetical protein
MKKKSKMIGCGIALFVLTMLIFWAVSWYRHKYPYGNRHICLKAIGLSIRMYSNRYNGHFPAGKESPEASISLLYTEGDLEHCDLLSGKSMLPEKAEKVLKAGGMMDNESCSWHYVEGLTERDSVDFAIVWDKVLGLGHHSQLTSDGSTEVLYLDGHTAYIKASEWDDFLKKQEELHKAKKQNKTNPE